MAAAYTVLLLTVLAAVAASTFVPSSISEQSREKRQTPGGVVVQDPNDPKYKELARESYSKYLETSGSSEAIMPIYKSITVTKATSQIVEGTRIVIDFMVYTISELAEACHSEIWERDWLNKKDINVKCWLVSVPSRTERN